MKLLTFALAIGLTASAASATPFYVGQNIRPQNNITLEFQDTMTKKLGAREKGNIVSFELKADFTPVENVSVGAALPFYMANKKALEANSGKNAIGNMGLNIGFGQALSDSSDSMSWGYTASMHAFMPTSRNAEGSTIADVNPTTDFYQYNPKTTTFAPTFGVFAENEMMMIKANLGYGWSYISNPEGSSDKNRNTFTWQAAASWKALPNLSANLEYNNILFDKATAGAGKKWKHAVAPSISGNYGPVLASAFASLPLDKTTRDFHNVAFGANLGYLF